MHRPVLLQEAIDGLALRSGDTVVDATLGSGGHSAEILRRDSEVKLITIDADPDAVTRGRKRIGKDGRVTFVNDNFRNLTKILHALGIEKVEKVLFDFGFSSDQLEASGRGFSFLRNEPLVMTFSGSTSALTAYEIVNSFPEDDIRVILRKYGEERFAGRIAKAIVRERRLRRIGTTADLVRVITSALPQSRGKEKIHPATRTFQALRIAVNDELSAIEEGIKSAWEALSEEGRIAAISFHSLEDRIVKELFRGFKDRGEGEIVTKKPITASEEEKEANPRARSAKLRIVKRKA